MKYDFRDKIHDGGLAEVALSGYFLAYYVFLVISSFLLIIAW